MVATVFPIVEGVIVEITLQLDYVLDRLILNGVKFLVLGNFEGFCIVELHTLRG